MSRNAKERDMQEGGLGGGMPAINKKPVFITNYAHQFLSNVIMSNVNKLSLHSPVVGNSRACTHISNVDYFGYSNQEFEERVKKDK